MRDPDASLFTILGRAIRRRCPRCGEARAFVGWATLAERCPRCGFKFEREPGYWVGALIINMAVSLFLFLVTIATVLAVTWPDVPWDGLFVTTIGLMLVVPAAFYPWSKSMWMAIELSYHRLEPAEQIEAELHAETGEGRPG